jgi:hypothetical protein
LTTLRRSADGSSSVLHVLNLDYDATTRRLNRRSAELWVPLAAVRFVPRVAVASAYDAAPVELAFAREGDMLRLTLPPVHVWTMVAMSP